MDLSKHDRLEPCRLAVLLPASLKEWRLGDDQALTCPADLTVLFKKGAIASKSAVLVVRTLGI